MTAQPVAEYFELADYAGVVRRRSAMIVAFALAGLALGTAYAYVAPRVYTASVLIQVNALPTNANALGGRTGGPVNMDNEGQIVQSATVATIAQSKLRISLPVTTLLNDIHVAVPPNTTFLQVSCDMGSARLAERCANAFGRAYLYNRRLTALGVITSGIRQLQDQATALEASVEQLHAKLGKGGLKSGSAARGIAELELSARLSRLNTIQTRISAVTPLVASLTGKNNFVGQIVTPAVAPANPVSPKKKLLLPSGLTAGLVVGLIFAFIWDWRRPRIYAVRDVRRRISGPAVFSLLDIKNEAQAVFPPPRSRTGQVYSELAALAGISLGDGHHVLLVTGTSPAAGNGAAAANLASALARTRGETMLICADPNAMTVPGLLGNGGGRGLAEVLAGTATVGEVARRSSGLPRLRVLTPGNHAAGTVYDMRLDKVSALMQYLRREVRYVVIDVPPPGTDTCPFSLVEFADGAIVVIRARVSRPDDLTDCTERLERMRTKVLAAIVLPPGAATGRSRGIGPGASSPSIQPGRREDYYPVKEQPAGTSGLSGAWRPRTASENWPLRGSGQDEEPGVSDPLMGG